MTPQRYQRLRQCLLRRQLDLTVLMENVHKPHNFAAIIRSCDAVGVHRAHAVTESGGISSHHDTAAGANKWVYVDTYRDIQAPLALFRDNRFQILAAHVRPGSVDFRDVDYGLPTAVVMGSELEGISEAAAAAADRWIHIPMQGMVESFNVSVATALILYEAQRQRERAGLYDRPQLAGRRFDETLFEWCYPRIADYCQRHGFAYPELDAEGDMIGGLPRRA
jgi:tRNA (guanosine-2'-O-)-methyltransferase